MAQTRPQAESLYGLPQPLQGGLFPSIIAKRNPATTDTGYPLSQMWVNKSANTVYVLSSVVGGSANWQALSSSTSALATLTGNSGGAISPTASNINIVGSGPISVAGAGSTLTISLSGGSAPIEQLNADSGSATPAGGAITTAGTANQITTTGSGSTVTWSLPSAITAPGSLTTTTGLTSGTSLTVTTSATVGTTLGVTGTSTLAALTQVGTCNINHTGNAATTIGNSSGSGSITVDVPSGNLTVVGNGNTIAIGTDAAANVVQIGSSTGAASLTELVGTGNYSLDGAATSTYTFAPSVTSGTINFGGTGANTGTMTIAGGTGAQTVNIAHSTGGKTVNIADGAGANLVTIGSSNTTSALTLKCGTGNFSLDGAATSTYAVGASTTSGTITIGGTAQTGTMTLGSSSGTNTQIIAGGTGATTLQIANAQTGGSVSIGAGMTTGTIAIGGTGAQTGTITLGGGTGAQTVNVATGGTGVKTVHIADSAVANVVTMGSTTGAASTTIQAGTGGLSLSAGGAVSMAPVTGSAASANITLNGRVGQSTHTGLTTASGSSQVFVITNSAVTGTTQAIFVSADNLGSNDAQMSITRVLQAANTLTVTLKNNGAAALNGDVHINWWILN